MTTNTPNKYTVWNQAVEAVEIYLARNPRELDEEQIISTCNVVYAFLYDAVKYNALVIDPAGVQEQGLVANTLAGL